MRTLVFDVVYNMAAYGPNGGSIMGRDTSKRRMKGVERPIASRRLRRTRLWTSVQWLGVIVENRRADIDSTAEVLTGPPSRVMPLLNQYP